MGGITLWSFDDQRKGGLNEKRGTDCQHSWYCASRDSGPQKPRKIDEPGDGLECLGRSFGLLIPAGRDGGSSGAARDAHLIDEIGGGSIDTTMGLFWLEMTILWDYIVLSTLNCISGKPVR